MRLNIGSERRERDGRNRHRATSGTWAGTVIPAYVDPIGLTLLAIVDIHFSWLAVAALVGILSVVGLVVRAEWRERAPGTVASSPRCARPPGATGDCGRVSITTGKLA